MKKLINSLFNKTEEKEDRNLYGDIVDLRYSYETDEKTAYDGIPTVYYDIVLHDAHTRVGNIDLRLKMDEDMYYYGHVGYSVIYRYRGNNYSYEACKLLFKEAKQRYGLNELILTCNPENVASYKTLKKLNGELIEVVQVPKDHELYKLGDKMKCIFRYKINI